MLERRVSHIKTGSGFFVGLEGAERQAVFDEYARFMSDYDKCLQALLRLEEGIIWPSGTWKMVHELNHAVAP